MHSCIGNKALTLAAFYFLYNPAFIYMPTLQKEGKTVISSFFPTGLFLCPLWACVTTHHSRCFRSQRSLKASMMENITKQKLNSVLLQSWRGCFFFGGGGIWQPTTLLRLGHLVICSPYRAANTLLSLQKAPSSTRQPLSSESASDGPLRAPIEIL